MVACFEDADGIALYIDIVREVIITPVRIAYVDLYVDVILKNGVVLSKDEELLTRLDEREAQQACSRRAISCCGRFVPASHRSR